jgi:NADPH:quinone reductase-like Zn-dependent oxidoreductase
MAPDSLERRHEALGIPCIHRDLDDRYRGLCCRRHRRGAAMKAAIVERFGGPEAVAVREVSIGRPAAGEVLVRVAAAGVGPWDAWVRAGRSALVGADRLPATLGADLSGAVVAVGPDVADVVPGDEVFGVTNERFIGAHAEFAIAQSRRIARKPSTLSFVEAAAVPVVAATAWQLLFERARIQRGETVLVLSASGAVGSFTIRLAHRHGVRVLATTSAGRAKRVCDLGAERAFAASDPGLEAALGTVDAVIDLAGGPLQALALRRLKRDARLISAVAPPDADLAAKRNVRAEFFLVDVNRACLQVLASLFDDGVLAATVGVALPLEQARLAHEMLEGMRPRPHGRIVLVPAARSDG